MSGLKTENTPSLNQDRDHYQHKFETKTETTTNRSRKSLNSCKTSFFTPLHGSNFELFCPLVVRKNLAFCQKLVNKVFSTFILISKLAYIRGHFRISPEALLFGPRCSF